MLPLDQDLQTPKNNLEDFASLSTRVLSHLTNVLSDSEIKGKYIIHNSVIADNVKFLRPVNQELIHVADPVFSGIRSRLSRWQSFGYDPCPEAFPG